MEKTKIEYCDSTWNPVSGCYNVCDYCYARRIAERFKGCDVAPDGHTDKRIITLKERQYRTTKDGKLMKASYPYGFTPTFHEYRLNESYIKKLGKTVFVCSMADLFAPWVPDEWIIKIFDVCKADPNRRWLFLTKYPERYIELAKFDLLPKGDRFWYGSTSTCPDTQVSFCSDGEYHMFASIEPILESFEDADAISFLAENIDWIIIGAETGNRKGRIVPERKWIENLVLEFRNAGKAVFMKDSMKPIWGEDILSELPWKLR